VPGGGAGGRLRASRRQKGAPLRANPEKYRHGPPCPLRPVPRAGIPREPGTPSDSATDVRPRSTPPRSPPGEAHPRLKLRIASPHSSSLTRSKQEQVSSAPDETLGAHRARACLGSDSGPGLRAFRPAPLVSIRFRPEMTSRRGGSAPAPLASAPPGVGLPGGMPGLSRGVPLRRIRLFLPFQWK